MSLPEPRITAYQRWLAGTHGLRFDRYDTLWQWSVTELDAFWRSIWDYFAVETPTPPTVALAEARMPGARWFPGVQLNYARQALRHGEAAHAAGLPAMVWADEPLLNQGEVSQVSWPDLAAQVVRPHDGRQPGRVDEAPGGAAG
jgi:acetoacetyl-CoA synthetase